MNLIWSIEHQAWWRQDWNGYTRDPLVAGLYDERETARIIGTANAVKVQEVVIPEEVVFYAPRVDWATARCQEVQGSVGALLLYCGAPAVVVVKHLGRREGPYTMCAECAAHNTHNRGAVVLRERS